MISRDLATEFVVSNDTEQGLGRLATTMASGFAEVLKEIPGGQTVMREFMDEITKAALGIAIDVAAEVLTDGEARASIAFNTSADGLSLRCKRPVMEQAASTRLHDLVPGILAKMDKRLEELAQTCP